MFTNYFDQEPIRLGDAIKKYKLTKAYIKKLVEIGYIRIFDHNLSDEDVLVFPEAQNKLQVLSEHPEYRDKVLEQNPSYYYEYSTELIEYHPYHDFIDRYCWLIKLFYTNKESIQKKNYRLDILFQNFLLKNKFSIPKLKKQFTEKNDDGKLVFHLKKGWYNELVRSLPLSKDYLNISTKRVKGTVLDTSSVAWNITQSYYSMYEYINVFTFLFNQNFDTRGHREPAKNFNNNISGKLKTSLLFYPFNLSSKVTGPNQYPKYSKFQYASYPRDPSKKLQDVNCDVIRVFKKLSTEDTKGKPASLIDFMYSFRVWSNYTGVDTIIKLKNGYLVEYLLKNLGIINFFMGGMAELSAIAKLGEKAYLEVFEDFSKNYILQQSQFRNNILLVPLFIRHRIYKHLGILSKESSFVNPNYDDPISFYDFQISKSTQKIDTGLLKKTRKNET